MDHAGQLAGHWHRPFGGDGPPTAGGELRALEFAGLEAIAAGKPLAVVADVICSRAEKLAPELTCALLLVRPRLSAQAIAGPRLPAPYLELLRARVVDGAIPPVLDVAQDSGCAPFRQELLQLGLPACWTSPVLGRDRRLIGIVALHFAEYRQPTECELLVAESCVHLARLAIEHDEVRTRLEESNHRLDVALGSISQGVCFFDGMQRLILANRRYAEIYGLDPELVVPGMSLPEIVALRAQAGSGPAMSAERYLSWRESLQGSDGMVETEVELCNGKVIAVQHQPMPDRGWVSTHEDVTARRATEERILHMARHDPLTGLANRLLFRERLEQELDRRKNEDAPGIMAVLCIDLDRFKPVNDSLGHPAGDKLLRAVAGRLVRCVRERDIVTRLGGDEFAILSFNLRGPEAAGALAERVIAALGQAFEIDGTEVTIGASIGIALSPGDGAGPEELFGNADVALYQAKTDQRGTYRFFATEMQTRLQCRHGLERDLRLALKHEQFEIYYQPLMDVRQGTVCSFEALLRWRHPVRGLQPPGSFIPLAEETGLIVPIGAWALLHACREAATWPEHVTVSVNLSPAQFKSPALLETVRHALAESGLTAARLELEITEGLLLENTGVVLGTLHELGRLGVRISMDDFGTGHSSLNYLRSFPFHKIKIDQSFVRDVAERTDAMAIVRAIVGLGRSLNMVTTAEGVETTAQLARLREEGCNEVQGFLFSQPRPAVDIPAMLQNRA